MNKIFLVLVCFLILLASLVPGYLIFFKLAPWLCSLLPPSQWSPILKVVIFIAVAYFGGIGITLFCAITGLVVFFKGLVD